MTLFDPQGEYIVPIRLQACGGKSTNVAIRWPTDNEWAEHARKRKVIMRMLGRGNSQTDVDGAQADFNLAMAIKLDGVPDLTLGEAKTVIDLISKCDIHQVHMGDVEAEIELRVLTGHVKHVLKIPNMDQVIKFEKVNQSAILRANGIQDVRFNVAAVADLWDECGGRGTEGYKDGLVPNIHKDGAFRGVIRAVQEEVSAGYDEPNF